MKSRIEQWITDPKFNVFEFLRYHHRTLSDDDLQSLKVDLKAKLFHLVYDGYPIMVQLSKKMEQQDLNDKMNKLKEKGNQMQHKIRPLLMVMEEKRALLETVISEWKELENKKEQTIWQLEILDCLVIIETSVESEDFKNDTDLDKLSMKYNRLHYLKKRILNPSFMQSIEWRMNRMEEMFFNSLENMFISNLDSMREHDLSESLQLYSFVNKHEMAYHSFTKRFVLPHLQSLIKDKNQNDLLKLYFQGCQDFMKSSMCQKLFEQSHLIDKKYSFLINACFNPMLQFLVDNVSSIFQPGIPNSFYKNYCLCVEFFQTVAKYCKGKECLSFKNNPFLFEFYKKWNINVYFQIRYKDIITEFEEVLAMPVIYVNFDDYDESTKERFHLQPTSRALQLIRFCWSNKCFIPNLSFRFWKLTLQIIKRYMSWVMSLSLLKENSLPKLMSALFDLYYVEDSILNLYNTTISQLLTMDSTIVLDCLKTINEKHRETIIQLLEEQLLKVYLEQMNDTFSQIRLIPGLYRRTNQPMPSQPSLFLSHLFTPVSALKEKYQRLFESDVIERWSKQLTHLIVEKYTAISLEVLQSIQRTEESLKKLKRVRLKNDLNEDSETISDESKMRHQFHLDFIELEKQVTISSFS